MKEKTFSSKDELLAYAKTLTNKSVREALNSKKKDYEDIAIDDNSDILSESNGMEEYHGKGNFGNFLEEQYFGKKNDSKSAPDFSNLGIELKSSPLKKNSKGTFVVKERLVLGMIDYFEMAEETFDSSHFLGKNAHLLLVFYIYEKAVNLFDIRIDLVDFWDIVSHDLNQIREDWETIHKKIREGNAHLISEGDTLLLGACTKGQTREKSLGSQPYSNIQAKSRALCFKTKYINTIYSILKEKKESSPDINRLQDSSWRTLPDILNEKFSPFIGKDTKELCAMLNHEYNVKEKSIYGSLSRKMLGLTKKTDSFYEFDIANIQIKSIRIEANGSVKEAMSFKNIVYLEIESEEWEDSSFFEELTSHFVFTFFRRQDKDSNNYIFDGFLFWHMPLEDIEEAHKVWEDTKEKICNNDFLHFLKQKDNRVSHVRPKAQNANDTMETPFHTQEKKMCFWLNNKYIRDVIVKEHEKNNC